jgi:23S rRNA pseudouridine955/2504/2580 synthase
VEACTEYRVLASCGLDAAVVAMECRSGRKHQLRVHCAQQLMTPLLGDDKYGIPYSPFLFAALGPQPPRLHLHAHTISIPGYHDNGAPLEITAPLPQHMLTTMKALKLSIGMGDTPAPARIRWSRPSITRFKPKSTK